MNSLELTIYSSKNVRVYRTYSKDQLAELHDTFNPLSSFRINNGPIPLCATITRRRLCDVIFFYLDQHAKGKPENEAFKTLIMEKKDFDWEMLDEIPTKKDVRMALGDSRDDKVYELSTMSLIKDDPRRTFEYHTDFHHVFRRLVELQGMLDSE